MHEEEDEGDKGVSEGLVMDTWTLVRISIVPFVGK